MFSFFLILLQKNRQIVTMKLVIMTKSEFFVEEDIIITSLFEEGLDALHVSKPGSSPMYTERLLSLLPEDCYRKVTVHEHYYLKQEYDLGAIHLDNATDMVPTGYKGKYSRTCADLRLLPEMKKKSNYVFLRNIFDCIDDKNGKSTFTIPQLENAARQGLIDKKVYALGGMTMDNLNIAKQLGFGGVVICGDLWNRFDIQTERDFRDVIEYFVKLRKTVS